LSLPNTSRPSPRLVKGFRDVFAAEVALKQWMIERVRAVYERYGYVPLETPAVEYVDVLGKFLPESATPAGGIFPLRNPDVEVADTANPDYWLSLRYDLTAPLARVAAQHVELQRPFRRYQVGPVYRYERPGPGRFREFTQFDFDAVGVASAAADAEACCVMCDAMEALGFAGGDFVVKLSNRKIMQGVLETAGIAPASLAGGEEAGAEMDERSLTVLRAIDKLDRLGERGVVELLGRGRTDETSHFTPGAGLDAAQIEAILKFLHCGGPLRSGVLDELEPLIGSSLRGGEGIAELRRIDELLRGLGYGDERVRIDPTVIRGLAYYTGPVYEGAVTRSIVDEEGRTREFGSVYGGGRYDDLVERFLGKKVPATGASIGVDRLLEAVKLLRPGARVATADVLVLVLERDRIGWSMELAQSLRREGVNAETYLGEGGMRAQVKYADKMGIPYAVIAGGDELSRGVVQIKDLAAGAAAAGSDLSRDEWRKGAASQREVPEGDVVRELVALLRRDD
jgi:histidyl-tRNA synthetase